MTNNENARHIYDFDYYKVPHLYEMNMKCDIVIYGYPVQIYTTFLLITTYVMFVVIPVVVTNTYALGSSFIP